MLTDAGVALLRHARSIHGAVAVMEAELHDFAQGLRGLIRVAANKSAIMETLPMELAGFLATHPLIRIDVEEGISPNIVQAVASNAADIGIYGGNSRWRDRSCCQPFPDGRHVGITEKFRPSVARHG